LANADAADLTHAHLQIARFNDILAYNQRAGYPRPRWVHLANSAAACQLPQAHFNMVRAGILLYGVYPSDDVVRTIIVKPALRWVSHVVYFKVQPADHPVSYGSEWQSANPERIVTVPVGYGDGYFRSISGHGEVIINGRRYPIIGRVCMDQFMVHIGRDSAFNGDEVVLLGQSAAGGCISIEELAVWAGTIPYEILTNINGRVPRIYKETSDYRPQTSE
jgi:alanine racemase